MAGLEAALRVLTEPGDGVVLLTPAYPPFFVLLHGSGWIRLNHGTSLALLREALRRIDATITAYTERCS